MENKEGEGRRKRGRKGDYSLVYTHIMQLRPEKGSDFCNITQPAHSQIHHWTDSWLLSQALSILPIESEAGKFHRRSSTGRHIFSFYLRKKALWKVQNISHTEIFNDKGSSFMVYVVYLVFEEEICPAVVCNVTYKAGWEYLPPCPIVLSGTKNLLFSKMYCNHCRGNPHCITLSGQQHQVFKSKY